MRTFLTIALATLAGAGIATFAQAPNNDLGYTDTPMLPGINYRWLTARVESSRFKAWSAP